MSTSHLSNTNVTNLTPLAGLIKVFKLKSFNLSGTKVTDIAPRTSFELRRLTLRVKVF